MASPQQPWQAYRPFWPRPPQECTPRVPSVTPVSTSHPWKNWKSGKPPPPPLACCMLRALGQAGTSVCDQQLSRALYSQTLCGNSQALSWPRLGFSDPPPSPVTGLLCVSLWSRCVVYIYPALRPPQFWPTTRVAIPSLHHLVFDVNLCFTFVFLLVESNSVASRRPRRPRNTHSSIS